MIKRFCLYGFLKEQRYYEPFLVLILLKMGLNYSAIGLLIGFRALLVNLMEIPSGAFADLWGRKNALFMSLIAYIVYFGLVGYLAFLSEFAEVSPSLILFALFVSTIFFSLGEAFRTGTHKSMIFTWLRREERSDEKSKIYGFTRSWSKLGAAFSIILSALLVFYFKNYYIIFFFSIIPYLINLINIKTYPDYLSPKGDVPSFKDIFVHLKNSFTTIFQQKKLQKMLWESVSLGGLFESSKEYLQPLLVIASAPLVYTLFNQTSLNEAQESVISIGPVYLLLYLLGAYSSRNGYKIVNYFQGDEIKACRLIWQLFLGLMILLGLSSFRGITSITIATFVLFYALENLWRPLIISRFNTISTEKNSSTLLSIQSQGSTLGTVILAPILGFSIHLVEKQAWGALPFWPIAIPGILFGLIFIRVLKASPSPVKYQKI